MSGISVRMLHHYDKINILKPNCINSSGYRLYTNKEIERLQQILFFKELDFTLQEIKSILDNPYFDRKKALISHKELLLEKKLRLEKIIHTVNKTINSIERGVDMNKNEMFNSFDSSEIDEHRKKYAKETKEKYGDTNAYKESKDKTSIGFIVESHEDKVYRLHKVLYRLKQAPRAWYNIIGSHFL